MLGFCLLCAIISGFLSFKFPKAIVLFFTSVIGSYSFVRGCSYFLGGFPNEAVIFESLTEKKEIPGLTEAFWIYLFLFAIGSIAGIFYQVR